MLLEDGEPQSVLTGGTNLSEGGIFGHSNGVHIVQEPGTAAAYSRYWELLHEDPTYPDLKPEVVAESPVPAGKPPVGTSAFFSPRDNLDLLEWYAALAAGAQDGLFMTFAFGMHEGFQEVYRTSEAGMRYLYAGIRIAHSEIDLRSSTYGPSGGSQYWMIHFRMGTFSISRR